MLWISKSSSVVTAKSSYYKKAKLQAGIKPTALCLVIDKENSIEFPLDLPHYIYNYYVAMLLYFS